MTKMIHTFAEGVEEQAKLASGSVWRPPVPMPFYVGFGLKKSKCVCGKVFKDEQQYREHYIYYAVWQNESGYIPWLMSQAAAGKVKKK